MGSFRPACPRARFPRPVTFLSPRAVRLAFRVSFDGPVREASLPARERMIGPAIEDGTYYGFSTSSLPTEGGPASRIEAEMARIQVGRPAGPGGRSSHATRRCGLFADQSETYKVETFKEKLPGGGKRSLVYRAGGECRRLLPRAARPVHGPDRGGQVFFARGLLAGDEWKQDAPGGSTNVVPHPRGGSTPYLALASRRSRSATTGGSRGPGSFFPFPRRRERAFRPVASQRGARPADHRGPLAGGAQEGGGTRWSTRPTWPRLFDL